MESPGKTTRQRAHTLAGKLVEKALAMGHDEDWIASICGVGKSSIFRWKKTGKGESSKVRKLEAAIGPIAIGPDDIANLMIETYLKKKSAFHFTDSELYRIGGFAADEPSFLRTLTKILYTRGYFLLKARTKGVGTYHLLSQAKVRAASSEKMEFTSHHRIVADDDNIEPFGETL